nr:unnamed protein product [Callosobruchus chinensis]CAH7754311.1 unnamed protein product [Callosobruchus chinensis]
MNISQQIIFLELNDTQKKIYELAKEFAKEEIIPIAAKHDETGEYPAKIIRKAWELGITNSAVPEHCGKSYKL